MLRKKKRKKNPANPLLGTTGRKRKWAETGAKAAMRCGFGPGHFHVL